MHVSNYILLVISLQWTFLLATKKKHPRDIKKEDLLPKDHVAGSRMERDGDINKEYHHEAFLGTLIKDGTLSFKNKEGYEKLIEIFHKVDSNKDHNVDEKEMKEWIHDRIMEHYNKAQKEAASTFEKVDHDENGEVKWPEYKAQLEGKNPEKHTNDSTLAKDDSEGKHEKAAKRWIKADLNEDNILDKYEFVAFLHPESNWKMIWHQATDLMPSWDKDGDWRISREEFCNLNGTVESKELQMQMEGERETEFRLDMDSDSDGFVTMQEFMDYLDPRHVRHADKEAKYLMFVADQDRSGKLNEKEMLLNYKTFTGSSLGKQTFNRDEL